MEPLRSLFGSLGSALALTLLLELLFSLFWGLRKKELLLVILMNILTNPAVNLLYWWAVLCGWNTPQLVLALEVAVVITEGFCCRGIVRRPWLFAFFVNLFSFGMGELLKILI